MREIDLRVFSLAASVVNIAVEGYSVCTVSLWRSWVAAFSSVYCTLGRSYRIQDKSEKERSRMCVYVWLCVCVYTLRLTLPHGLDPSPAPQYLRRVNDQAVPTPAGLRCLPGGTCPHSKFTVLILMC